MNLQELIESDTSFARTDKDRHGYVPIYESLFERFRDTALPILEIGIGNGGSARVWSLYFPNAKIHGVDIRHEPEWIPSSLCFHHGNAAETDFLASVAKCGPFAIVIDDGGHRGHEQEASFRALWPFVVPGGLYVIEDLHASYMPEYHPSVMPFLKSLADTAVNYPEGDIASIQFFHKLFVAQKKGNV